MPNRSRSERSFSGVMRSEAQHPNCCSRHWPRRACTKPQRSVLLRARRLPWPGRGVSASSFFWI